MPTLVEHANAVARLATSLGLEIGHDAVVPAYQHAGALVSDAILQAGVRYATVVVPRVRSILHRFPSACTISTFAAVIAAEGAAGVLAWRDIEKPRRLEALVDFLMVQSVDTVTELGHWLQRPQSCCELLQLRGIGPKTVDYLKQLSGLNSVAVDRHLVRFVSDAGVDTRSYSELRFVVETAAELLGVPPSAFDRAIWRHQSELGKGSPV